MRVESSADAADTPPNRRDSVIEPGGSDSPVATLARTKEENAENEADPMISSPQSPSTLTSSTSPDHFGSQTPALVEAAVAGFLSQWSNTNVDLWWGALDTKSIEYRGSLAFALQATSMMALALRPEFKYIDVRTPAEKSYGQALRAINLSLRDSEEILSNNTFLAVILTALFEASIGKDMHAGFEEKLTANHVRGMMTLVNVRGPSQFQTVEGRRIFLYAYFNWTTTVMPEVAVMPHLTPTLIPPLSEEINNSLLEHDFSADGPAFRLLPLVYRSLSLRVSTISTMYMPKLDSDTIISILSEIETLDRDLLSWNSSLFAWNKNWGEDDRLYQMLTTSWFRTQRIFLADLSIRCHQRLARLDGQNHDSRIWRHVDDAQNAVDEICARLPYSFGEDNPRKRKPHVKPRFVPDAKITYLYHSSFEYPLLVASMIWTLPPWRQDGIEVARRQCALACGLTRPRRQYPRVLIYLPPEERTRYIRYRNERMRLWNAARAEEAARAQESTRNSVSSSSNGIEIAAV